MRKTRVVYVLAVLIALMLLWPNFVHEPLHALAAQSQGVVTKIVYDFKHVPARPVVQWTGQFSSNLGYQFFLLAPSIVAICILVFLITTKHAFVESHIALPIYLSIELSTNVLKYNSAISDFRILQSLAFGNILAIITVLLVLIMTGAVVSRALHIITKKKQKVNYMGDKPAKCVVCGLRHSGPHFPPLPTKDIIVNVICNVDNLERELERRYYGCA